jgi:hypothetical protein
MALATTILQPRSFPIEQVPNLEHTEHTLGGWSAGTNYDFRLLARSRRFDMRPPMQLLQQHLADLGRLERIVAPLLPAIDGLLAGDPDAEPANHLQALPPDTIALLLDLFADLPLLQEGLALVPGQRDAAARLRWSAVGDAFDTLLWRVPWAKEMVRFYEALQHRHLRSAAYTLIAWPPADVSPQAIATTLRHATGREVTLLDRLPGILDGAYREQATRLKPEQPGLPWLAALISYDARGVWDATTLHGLLDADDDVAVAIDVQTLSRNQGMRAAEMAYNAARVVARDAQVVDMRAGRVIASAERVMHELVNESLHTVQIGVLVGGATEAELETHVAETSARLGTRLRLLRPAGAQGELLKLWSTTPRRQIDAPLKPRAMLSHGVGCCLGLLGYHQASQTGGIFWGMDAVRRAPLFFDLFANNQAAHMVILGKTGYGKTFFMNLLALRGAALAGHQVIAIDAFGNGERLAAAAGAGAHCLSMGLDTPINILDVVYTDDEVEGGWIANQVQHAIGLLALLLGTPAHTADGKERQEPRPFSIAERGVLDRALGGLYAEVDTHLAQPHAPILSDLIARLEQIRIPEALGIARDLRMLLYGGDHPDATTLTVLGRGLDVAAATGRYSRHDMTCHDLSRVPEWLKAFYFTQNIVNFLRYMRDPQRDRSRKILLLIDEFGYLTQIEALARMAATICKVARKYGIGLVAIDQNPITFLGSENGRAIFENAAAKVLFHLDDVPARQMGEAISDLTPAHIAFLSHAAVGEALAVVGNDVYVMAVEANPKELRALRGS